MDANAYNARPLLGARYVDPWQNRYFTSEDPFALSAGQVALHGPQPLVPPVQRHPDYEALRNKAYMDAIKYHDGIHQQVYQSAPVETQPSETLIKKLLPDQAAQGIQQAIAQPTPQPASQDGYAQRTATPIGGPAGTGYLDAPQWGAVAPAPDPYAQYAQRVTDNMKQQYMGEFVAGSGTQGSPALDPGTYGGLTRMDSFEGSRTNDPRILGRFSAPRYPEQKEDAYRMLY